VIITVSIKGSRISPVFDTSTRLLLINSENWQTTHRQELAFSFEDDLERVNFLKSLHTEVLICGAISRFLAQLVDSSGIQLHPFLAGETEKVIEAFLARNSLFPRFSMPGCGQRQNRGWRQGGRGGKGRGACNKKI